MLHIQYQPAAYALHGAINLLPWLVRSAAVVTTFHDLRVPYLFPKAGSLRRAAVAALAKRSNATICVADTDLAQVQRWRVGRPPTTTAHVPLGDQLDAPLPDGYTPAAWRAQFGLTGDAPIVAHFGLINDSKGVRELVRALAELPNARLLLIGETLGASDPTNAAYLEEVRADIERLGLRDRTHWTGRVSPGDVLAWLSAADAVALPFLDGASLRRTSLITAWRRGLPVVTTEPAGPPEWRRSAPGRDAARYVAPGDPASLAAALRAVLTSPSQRAALSQNGREFGQRFAWPAVVGQTVAVYESAITQRRA